MEKLTPQGYWIEVRPNPYNSLMNGNPQPWRFLIPAENFQYVNQAELIPQSTLPQSSV